MEISKKFFTYQFLVITAGTVVGLYIYNNIVKRQQPQPLSLYSSYIPNISNRRANYMSPDSDTENNKDETEDIPEPPKYKLEITTLEYDSKNDYWIPTLSHVFYGNSQKEIDQLINSHRQIDTFFDSSFTGIFNWKGGTIQLKNITSGVTYS